MAYCIKCGVKLGDSEKKCPLCQTVVYHPDLKPVENAETPYPTEHFEKMQETSIRFKLTIATMIILIPTVLTLICDYSVNSAIIWSDIVVSSVCFLYCLIFIPLFVQKKEPVLYFVIDYAALLLFEWYLSFTIGGNWFWKFSLPLTTSIALIIVAAMLVKRFTRASNLIITAVIFFLSAIDCVFVEFLINKAFRGRIFLIWSYYPLITFIIVGVILILCDRNQRLKDKLAKKFFI